jgi:uncharacterized protein
MTYHLAAFIVDRSKIFLIGSLLFTCIAAYGLRYLSFKNDYRMFFSNDNKELQAFEVLQKKYTKSDNVLFVVSTEEANVFTKKIIEFLYTFTERSWKLPFVKRVDSITNYQYSFADENGLVVNNLVRDPVELNDKSLEAMRNIVLSEPLLVNRLVSANGKVTGINVTFQLPEFETGREVPAVAEASRKLRDDMLSLYPDINVRITGGVMMNNAFPEASERDMKTLIPLMLLLIVISVGFFLRMMKAALCVLLILLCSMSAALGIAGWFGIALSPTSVTAPNIILILVVAFSIHILTSWISAYTVHKDMRYALIESIESNCVPIFISALTTSLGFLSMNSSDAPPFRDLGNITAIGLFVSFILCFTLLPSLLSFVKIPVTRKTILTSPFLQKISECAIQYRTIFFWSMSCSVVLLLSFVPKNNLNDEFIKYFGEEMEFRRATDYASEHLTGIYYIDYSLKAEKGSSVATAHFLKKIDDFAAWYRSQPEVLHVYSIADIVKRLNKNMNNDNNETYKIPDQNELIAQYLLLYEMSLPSGLDLKDRISLDRTEVRLTVTLKNISSQTMINLEKRAQAWLSLNAVPVMTGTGTGPSLMFANIGQRNIKSMISGELTALFIIFLSMVVTFRSIKMGLISMIPNIVPAGMAFGLWGIFVGQVGLAMTVVAAMTLGIIVDDTIHFIWKFVYAKKKFQKSSLEAVRYSFSKVGASLWIITFVFIAGFSVLGFSAFEINASMGYLTALVIALACLSELFFLPAILIRFG